MSVNLNTKDGISKFVKENLTNLSDGINDIYGPLILEELIKRISNTIEEFNQEMKEALSMLQMREEKKIEAIKQIQHSNDEDTKSKNEWEKKLEDIDIEKK